MSYTRLWIHLVFSTKNRDPFLDGRFKNEAIECIKRVAKHHSIQIVEIDGYADHLHILLKLKSTDRLATLVRLIKGGSSNWLSDNIDELENFQWQPRYFAESISPRALPAIRAYIRNQETHHKNKSSKEEMNQLMARHG